jgi:hypothetical protein
MKLLKNMAITTLFTLFLVFANSAAAMVCSCTSGNMTVEYGADGVITMKCSGGGRITCMIK